jgi:hypothetical protein
VLGIETVRMSDPETGGSKRLRKEVVGNLDREDVRDLGRKEGRQGQGGL